MRIITTEEHIVGTPLDEVVQKKVLERYPYYRYSLGKDLPYYPDFDLYKDRGEKRIADMDKHGIEMQVLSCPAQSQLLSPSEAIPLVQEVNDLLAEAVRRYPSRFAAFAALPWSDPHAAADELKRAVLDLGLKGALLGGRPSFDAEFLDDEKFDPILKAAAELNVPIYTHPGCPHPDVQKVYYDRLGEEVSARLSLFGWGWHNEPGVQLVRMILSGVFERYPDLQIIAGHWGEMVPFYLSRLDQALPEKATGLSRTITDTFAQNISVTPSGIFDYPQLQFCMAVLGSERIIHSVDFPLVENDDACAFIEDAPISSADKEKIAHGNAERLLGL